MARRAGVSQLRSVRRPRRLPAGRVAQARRRVRRHRLPRLRRATRRPHGRVGARRDALEGVAGRRRADVRGTHRRRCARLGPGRELRRATRSVDPSPDRVAERDARPRARGALRRARRGFVRRAPLCTVAPLPLHDRQPAGARPVPRPHGVVGAGAARPLALRLGADPFLGEHDFATFCRKGPAGSTTVRRVFESPWHDLGDGVLRYEIRATAFCWQMVRSIVGTLVDVGWGASGRATSCTSSGPATAPLRASSLRPRASASGKWATDRPRNVRCPSTGK